jgi:hypothetical protein
MEPPVGARVFAPTHPRDAAQPHVTRTATLLPTCVVRGPLVADQVLGAADRVRARADADAAYAADAADSALILAPARACANLE